MGDADVQLQLPRCVDAGELKALGISPVARPYVEPIASERDPWAGHYVSNAMARIVLNECMGYDMQIQNSGKGSTYLRVGRVAMGFYDRNVRLLNVSANPIFDSGAGAGAQLPHCSCTACSCSRPYA